MFKENNINRLKIEIQLTASAFFLASIVEMRSGEGSKIREELSGRTENLKTF